MADFVDRLLARADGTAAVLAPARREVYDLAPEPVSMLEVPIGPDPLELDASPLPSGAAARSNVVAATDPPPSSVPVPRPSPLTTTPRSRLPSSPLPTMPSLRRPSPSPRPVPPQPSPVPSASPAPSPAPTPPPAPSPPPLGPDRREPSGLPRGTAPRPSPVYPMTDPVPQPGRAPEPGPTRRPVPARSTASAFVPPIPVQAPATPVAPATASPARPGPLPDVAGRLTEDLRRPGAEQIIRVRIGRVEVRATPPPPPLVAPPPVSPTGPRLTLDAYLERARRRS